MASTAEVLKHHLDSFAAGDLEGILSDYTESSIVFTQEGKLRGQNELRPLYITMFAEFGQDGVDFELVQTEVEGDVAYINWKASTPNNDYLLGTDTFVVRDGKIESQTLSVYARPK